MSCTFLTTGYPIVLDRARHLEEAVAGTAGIAGIASVRSYRRAGEVVVVVSLLSAVSVALVLVSPLKNDEGDPPEGGEKEAGALSVIGSAWIWVRGRYAAVGLYEMGPFRLWRGSVCFWRGSS